MPAGATAKSSPGKLWTLATAGMGWESLGPVGVSALQVKPHLPCLKENRVMNKGLQRKRKIILKKDHHMKEPVDAKLCNWLQSHGQSRHGQVPTCKACLQCGPRPPRPAASLGLRSHPSLLLAEVSEFPKALTIPPFHEQRHLIRSCLLCAPRPSGKGGAGSLRLPVRGTHRLQGATSGLPLLCESR